MGQYFAVTKDQSAIVIVRDIRQCYCKRTASQVRSHLYTYYRHGLWRLSECERHVITAKCIRVHCISRMFTKIRHITDTNTPTLLCFASSTCYLAAPKKPF